VDLSVETRHADGFSIVDVIGDLDVYGAAKLRDAVTELIDTHHHQVVIDLTHVDFVDSTGLGVLVGAFKRIRAREGSLQLVSDQDWLLRLIRITGLADVFTFRESLDDALSPGRTLPGRELT